MWFAKQGPALAYHDAHADHIIIAEDISRHGHKRYGVVPRVDIDNFCGPYNELIRTNAVCKLYFDLDGGPEHGDEAVRDLMKLRKSYSRSLGFAMKPSSCCAVQTPRSSPSTSSGPTSFLRIIGSI